MKYDDIKFAFELRQEAGAQKARHFRFFNSSPSIPPKVTRRSRKVVRLLVVSALPITATAAYFALDEVQRRKTRLILEGTGRFIR